MKKPLSNPSSHTNSTYYLWPLLKIGQNILGKKVIAFTDWDEISSNLLSGLIWCSLTLPQLLILFDAYTKKVWYCEKREAIRGIRSSWKAEIPPISLDWLDDWIQERVIYLSWMEGGLERHLVKYTKFRAICFFFSSYKKESSIEKTERTVQKVVDCTSFQIWQTFFLILPNKTNDIKSSLKPTTYSLHTLHCTRRVSHWTLYAKRIFIFTDYNHL